ncbi:DoxX family membrane protein [Candidatus Berkelbacteria bacterium]|nr:DoxX family membrane protein [Candidatus Berkelbacteria bacterium]
MEATLLIGRIVFGLYFVMMGMMHFMKMGAMRQYAQMKGVPMAPLAVPVTGLMMLGGGLGVLLGIYTQVALWLIIIFLVPTAMMMHNFWKDTDPMMKQMNMSHFLKNMALAAAALMLLSLPLSPLF